MSLKHNLECRPACPRCGKLSTVIKKGKSALRADKSRVQRYYCKDCDFHFSDQTFSFDYRMRQNSQNQVIFRFLCSSSSQRSLSRNLQVNRKVIALRVKRYGEYCKSKLIEMRQTLDSHLIGFDEMESFEHTKCKPLTMPIAVDMEDRRILSVGVGEIAAKGKLAKISRTKYGIRKCQRSEFLQSMLENIKQCASDQVEFLTDKSPHYPHVLGKYFPDALHIAYKGRKPTVVGQGELKEGGYDPLFNLNHNLAMIRYGVKRLARKTWCTTKKKENLYHFLNIYAYHHNLYLKGVLPRLGMNLY